MCIRDSFSTYDTIDSAKKNQGKFVHIIAKYDPTRPLEFDPAKDPNYTSFYAIDSLGGSTKVVYRKGKPTDIERSERLVMKGKMKAEHFECSEIMLKCPSKYKDSKEGLQRSVEEQTSDSY